MTAKLKQLCGNRRTSRLVGLAGGALAMLLGAATIALPTRAGEDVTVSQRNREFTPGRVTMKRGGVARIVNDDKVTHHIFIDTPTMHFDSGEQPVGKVVDLHFDRNGTFPVQCAIHPRMHLDVVVE